MNISPAVSLASSANHLSVLTSMAVRGVRKVGDTLRVKLAVPTVSADVAPDALDAVWGLVSEGRTVRVFEGDSICTAYLAADGAQAWARRKSRFVRNGAVVEVSL